MVAASRYSWQWLVAQTNRCEGWRDDKLCTCLFRSGQMLYKTTNIYSASSLVWFWITQWKSSWNWPRRKHSTIKVETCKRPHFLANLQVKMACCMVSKEWLHLGEEADWRTCLQYKATAQGKSCWLSSPSKDFHLIGNI